MTFCKYGQFGKSYCSTNANHFIMGHSGALFGIDDPQSKIMS